MDWLWNIILCIIGVIIGLLAVSWPTSQIGCALFCGFPLLRRLRGYEYCFNLAGIKRLYVKTIVINSVILALVVWAMFSFAPLWMLAGGIAGYVWVFLVTFKQFGINKNSLMDFLSVLLRAVLPGKDEDALQAVKNVFGIEL